MPVHVDDNNFKTEVRQSRIPVLLDVWSPLCAPCRQMEPIIIRLATRYKGRVSGLSTPFQPAKTFSPRNPLESGEQQRQVRESTRLDEPLALGTRMTSPEYPCWTNAQVFDLATEESATCLTLNAKT